MNSKFKKNIFKIIVIVLLFILIVFFAMCSKYKENDTQTSQQESMQTTKMQFLNATLDDSSLILSYQITVEKNTPDSWPEITGDYAINDIIYKPINSSLYKTSDTSYLYYLMFDASKIKLDNLENVKVNAFIHNINIELQETVTIKNSVNSKLYEFLTPESTQILENVNVSITKFITNSYTNILNIKTDKTNYVGNSFEIYYKILDNQNREIAIISSEERQYDEKLYNDRLLINDLDINSKLSVELYMKMIDDTNFKKVATIPVDLSTAMEIDEDTQNLNLHYDSENYNFNYSENWKLTENLTADDVGPNSIYLGALKLDIPSTTNSEYPSSIFVKNTDVNTTLDEYTSEVRKENTQSPSEYYEEISSSEIDFKNVKGYQITSSSTDGETSYIKQDNFAINNGKVYRITFFGSEEEYNNLKNIIEDFVCNFNIS